MWNTELSTSMDVEMIGNYRCIHCTMSFKREANLLNHVRETHGVFHPHQCMKDESTYAECHESHDTFTVSSFMFLLEGWRPIIGENIICKEINSSIFGMFHGKVFGEVPGNLIQMFIDYLDKGTITAKITSIEVNNGYGLEVPVDYSFTMHDVTQQQQHYLPERTTPIENHVSLRIPPTEKRKYPQKPCVVCTRHGIRHDTRYWCKVCNVGLCKGRCFDEYHL